MIGYRYDNDGYLVGQVEVQESPLEPGVFLIPPNTSTTAPPSPPANTIPKWDGEGWVLVSNYSGIPYYSKVDKSVKFFEVGEIFDNNYTSIAPPEPDYPYIVWNSGLNNWAIDTALKTAYDNEIFNNGIYSQIAVKNQEQQEPLRKIVLGIDVAANTALLTTLNNDIEALKEQIIPLAMD